jgi:acyl-CoA dehydrogenase
MLSTVCLGANAVVHGGTEEQKREILPAVASGDRLLAVAWAEAKSRFDPRRVAVRARRSRDRWRLEGEKRLVLDGHAADRLIVSARTAGAEGDREGITLFLVDPRAPGVSVTRQSLLDGRGAAIVRLEDASVDDRSVLGEAGRGGDLLDRIIDRAAAALAAEMLGSMSAVFEMTLEYLKTRKQFGVPIGSFQALKHRAAVVYTEIELTRSAVVGASGALDAGAEDATDLVAIAKARASDAFLLAASEAVQMHGGIGMTDEHDVGFFLKRARAAEMTFGDAAWHRARFADRHGY